MDTASACGASITGTSIRSFPSRVQGERNRNGARHDKLGDQLSLVETEFLSNYDVMIFI